MCLVDHTQCAGGEGCFVACVVWYDLRITIAKPGDSGSGSLVLVDCAGKDIWWSG